jgi:hypothetical protein
MLHHREEMLIDVVIIRVHTPVYERPSKEERAAEKMCPEGQIRIKGDLII